MGRLQSGHNRLRYCKGIEVGHYTGRLRKIGLLALVPAILFALSLRAYYVGFFNDDAFYIIGAKSLLGGGYREINAPGAPPLVSYLPGFSILLAPLAFVSGTALWPYRIFSAALSLGGLAAIACVWEGMAMPVVASSFLVSALNPLMLSHSGVVLAEIPFLFLEAVFFLALRRFWERRDLMAWSGVVVLSGLLALLRPEGTFLVLALGLCLGMQRGILPALGALLGLSGLALFLLRNAFLTGRPLPYFLELSSAWPGLGAAGILGRAWGNLAYYLEFLFANTLWRIPGGRLSSMAAPLAAAGAALCALGALRPWRETPGWEKALKTFVVLDAFLYLAWPKRAGRYLIPVMPFLVAYLFAGIERAAARLGPQAAKAAVAAALAATLALCAAPDYRIVKASLLNDSPMSRAPEELYRWVRETTRPRDVFAAEFDGRFYLRARRPCLRLPRPASRRDLRKWIRSNRVSYLALEPAAAALRAPGGGYGDPWSERRWEEILSGWRLAPVFEDLPDGIGVYKTARLLVK